MTSRSRSALLAALVALLGSFLLATPAHAAERVVTITAEGVSPKVLQVVAGDTITFVNQDSSFGYRARATSENWDLDSGPVGLLPGRSYTHPDPITESGTYTYRVADGEAHRGSVVLPSPQQSSPTPSAPTSSAPQPRPTGGSSPAPAPSPTGGEGTAPAPPLPGEDDSLGSDPGEGGDGVAPAPAIALPDLPDLPGESAGPIPETAPEPQAGPTALAAVPGRLGSPPTARGYGLPAALAAVLAAGVASLLVRLLLAEPAGRRRARHVLTAPAPVATVD